MASGWVGAQVRARRGEVYHGRPVRQMLLLITEGAGEGRQPRPELAWNSLCRPNSLHQPNSLYPQMKSGKAWLSRSNLCSFLFFISLLLSLVANRTHPCPLNALLFSKLSPRYTSQLISNPLLFLSCYPILLFVVVILKHFFLLFVIFIIIELLLLFVVLIIGNSNAGHVPELKKR